MDTKDMNTDTSTSMAPEQKTNMLAAAKNMGQYLMPAAILVAGLLIAGAVLITDRDRGANNNALAGNAKVQPTNNQRGGGDPKNVRPVSADDHILGSQNADVTLVEYSDFQCPFCARIHPSLKQVVAESKGTVRWVYREYPLTSIHQNAQGAAVAAECAASLGGNGAFWKMADTFFADQSKLGQTLYVATAKSLGIPEAAFTACLTSGKFDEKILADTQNGTASGGNGTPYVVVINKDGEITSFDGALPYEQIKQIVDQARTVKAQ